MNTNTKKAVSIMCLFVLLANLLGFSVLADDMTGNEKAIEEKLSFLNKLDILQENFDPELFVKRSEAVTAVVKLSGYDIVNVKGLFKDLPIEHPDAEYIETAYALGIVSGYGDLFKPDKHVTQAEFIKMLTVVCGYEEFAKMKGGYPAGYVQAAIDAGIIKGGLFDAGKTLTGYDMVTFLNNALNADLVGARFTSDGKADYEVMKNYSLLDKVFKIKRIEGIITSTNKTSLYSASSLIGSIGINGNIYGCDDSLNGSLGYNVKAYINKDDEVIHIEKTRFNDTVRLDGSEIRDSSGKEEIIYEGSAGGLKRYSLSQNAVFFYNDRYYAGLETELVKNEDLRNPEAVYILLDNNKDGEYDFIFCEEYTYIQVKSIDLNNNIIYDKLNGKQLKLTASDKFIYKDGRSAEYEDIKYNYIIGIKLNKGQQTEDLNEDRTEPYEFLLLNDVISGNAAKISDTELNLNGESYLINKNSLFTADEYNKQSGSFYTDVNGNILTYDKYDIGSKPEYAYISKIMRKDNAEETPEAKLLLDGVGLCRKEISSRAAVYEDGKRLLYGAENIISSPDTVTGRLVKVNFNKDGQISRINLPVPLEFEKRGEKNTFNFVRNRTYKKRGNVILSDMYYLPKTSKVFIVPVDASDDEVYSIKALQDISMNEDFECELYEVDDEYNAGIALIKMKDASQGNVSSEGAVFVVEDISEALNADDEMTIRIGGMINGNKQKLTFLSGDQKAKTWLSEPSTIVPVIRNITADQIKPGDILQINESSGIIQSYRVMLDVSDDEFFARQGSDDYEDSAEWAGLIYPFVSKSMLFIYGLIEEKGDSYIKVNINGSSRNMFAGSVQNIYLFDSSENTSENTDIRDEKIKEGDKIFVTMVWGRERDIIVYR